MSPEEMFDPIRPGERAMDSFGYRILDTGSGPFLRVMVNGSFEDFPIHETQLLCLLEDAVPLIAKWKR